LVDLPRSFFGLPGYIRGSKNPLEGRHGHNVDLPGLSSLSFLSEELPHRLEEVHKKTSIPVDLLPKSSGLGGSIPLVPHEFAHRSPVLLLHISLIVFLAGPTRGKGDSLLLTVPEKLSVNESTVIIGVDPQKRERQAAADSIHPFLHRLLAAVRKHLQLIPPCVYIHRAQGMEVFTPGALPAMGHKVHLQESWAAVVLLREGSDRNLLSEKSSRLGGVPVPLRRSTMGTEEAVDGGRTGPRKDVPGRILRTPF